MTRSRRLPLLLAVFLVLPAVAWGPGSVSTSRGPAPWLGGAYTARADDASAIYFNPAGLAKVQGGELELGTSLIFVTREFAGEEPYPGYGVHEASPDAVFYPSHFYWARRMSSAMVVGLGVVQPFGLTTEWDEPDAFSGRSSPRKPRSPPSTSTPPRPCPWGPACGWAPGSWRALEPGAAAACGPAQPGVCQRRGAGDPRSRHRAAQRKQRPRLRLHLRMQVDVLPTVTLGANYRSKVAITYEGDADFTFTGAGRRWIPSSRPCSRRTRRSPPISTSRRSS